MFDRIRKITALVSALVVVVFVVFMINQTAAVVRLAEDLHGLAGDAVLWGLLGLYSILIAAPLWMWFRLPPPIEPPEVDAGPEHEAHLALLRKRLAGNRLLVGTDLADRASLEAAIADLDGHALEAVREAAAQVFLSTAISQSGRLDTFVVLSANSRLVWRIARIYYQRPTLRDMWHLYANVAGTAFMAGELDDVDVSEQVQPIVTSVVGSLGTLVPGLQVATSLVVNSVLSGSSNAFLTLRIGAIAQQYCAPLVATDRRRIRRLATARAAAMLGGIVSAGSRNVVKAVARASRDRLLRRSGEPDLAAEEASAEEEQRRRWWRRDKGDAALEEVAEPEESGSPVWQ